MINKKVFVSIFFISILQHTHNIFIHVIQTGYT